MEAKGKGFILIDEKYRHGVMLDEYKSIMSLVNADISEDGEEVFTSWVYPQRDREPIETAIPSAVRLGDKAKAIKVLRALLEQLEDVPAANTGSAKPAKAVTAKATSKTVKAPVDPDYVPF